MSNGSSSLPVGRVVGLWRYPVKSMGAQSLTEAEVSWHGLPGDRRWAFIRNDAPRSGFPWFTIRQRVDMNRYQPSFADPAKPDTSKTLVTTPSGDTFAVDDPALGRDLCPAGIQVIKQDRGVFDTFPLSLVTIQTIAKLSEMVGEKLDVLRFRPNILVDACRDTPFQEDSWVGRDIVVGDMRMRVDERDGRCVVITIDPETNERNPEVLRQVTEERERCLGVYGSIVKPGRVALDDEVHLA